MTSDELKIRSLIERWVICRDGGDFDGLARLWTPTGTMKATWFEGSATAFVAASQVGYAKGVNVTHALHGSLIEVAATRAVAQTKMSITQRVTHDGMVLDVVCTGRFVDWFRKEGGRWGLERRQCVYENDRVVPVVPGPPLRLDARVLEAFPHGYRHLAYFQVQAGLSVAGNLPGRTGAEVEALLNETEAWLRA